MGWDISLNYKDDREAIIPLHCAGSNVALGGSDSADMCLTYNYSTFYYQHLNREQGIRWLHGRTARETFPAMLRAISEMSNEGDDINDYWASTPHNAKAALVVLTTWAFHHPDAVWDVA